jgi:hypothetical protein
VSGRNPFIAGSFDQIIVLQRLIYRFLQTELTAGANRCRNQQEESRTADESSHPLTSTPMKP